MSRISASLSLNACDPKAGGGADRNWLAEVRNQGRTPGSCPQATVAGSVLLFQNPSPVGMVPVNGWSQPSVWARVTISAPTARPIASPAANAGCGCPGPAFTCAVTMASSACAWPGNRYASTTADAPATAPRSVSGASAVVLAYLFPGQ